MNSSGKAITTQRNRHRRPRADRWVRRAELIRLAVPRRVLALAAGLAVAVAAAVVAVAVIATNSGTVHWDLVWGDDFAGPAGQPPGGWKFDTGQGIFGDGDVAALTSSPANAGLDGRGGLAITALGHDQSWTSARIQTERGFAAPAGGELMVTASIQAARPGQRLRVTRRRSGCSAPALA